MKDRIFISYRRDDAAGHSGRLYDAFCTEFGKDRVFLDIDTLAPATQFEAAIEDALLSSRIMLVVIGPRWVQSLDSNGERRLEQPDDYVRKEIEGALRHRLEIVPVLVGEASLPRSEELPESIAPLLSRNAVELSDSRWGFDTKRLMSWALSIFVDSGANVSTNASTVDGTRRLPKIAAILLAMTLFGSIGYLWLWSDRKPDAPLASSSVPPGELTVPAASPPGGYVSTGANRGGVPDKDNLPNAVTTPTFADLKQESVVQSAARNDGDTVALDSGDSVASESTSSNIPSRRSASSTVSGSSQLTSAENTKRSGAPMYSSTSEPSLSPGAPRSGAVVRQPQANSASQLDRGEPAAEEVTADEIRRHFLRV